MTGAIYAGSDRNRPLPGGQRAAESTFSSWIGMVDGKI
jgi:hypothetical protein